MADGYVGKWSKESRKRSTKWDAPWSQADATHRRATKRFPLDLSLPPKLLLYIGSPPPPPCALSVEAEASAVIQPCQKSTWITLEVEKAKYYQYVSKRSKAAFKGFDWTLTWGLSHPLSKSQLLAQSKRKWETWRAAPKNYIIFIFQWVKKCLSHEKSVRE